MCYQIKLKFKVPLSLTKKFVFVGSKNRKMKWLTLNYVALFRIAIQRSSKEVKMISNVYL